jgi:hypothetical protein
MEEVAKLQVSSENKNFNSWMQNVDNLLKVFQHHFQHIQPLLGILGQQGEGSPTASNNVSKLSAL